MLRRTRCKVSGRNSRVLERELLLLPRQALAGDGAQLAAAPISVSTSRPGRRQPRHLLAPREVLEAHTAMCAARVLVHRRRAGASRARTTPRAAAAASTATTASATSRSGAAAPRSRAVEIRAARPPPARGDAADRAPGARDRASSARPARGASAPTRRTRDARQRARRRVSPLNGTWPVSISTHHAQRVDVAASSTTPPSTAPRHVRRAPASPPTSRARRRAHPRRRGPARIGDHARTHPRAAHTSRCRS